MFQIGQYERVFWQRRSAKLVKSYLWVGALKMGEQARVIPWFVTGLQCFAETVHNKEKASNPVQINQLISTSGFASGSMFASLFIEDTSSSSIASLCIDERKITELLKIHVVVRIG